MSLTRHPTHDLKGWLCPALFNLETGVERDEDGAVLGSTRLTGSQRLHPVGDATREAGSPVGPMAAADSPSAISVFRFKYSDQAPAALCAKA
jgi:hypothetical protein